MDYMDISNWSQSHLAWSFYCLIKSVRILYYYYYGIGILHYTITFENVVGSFWSSLFMDGTVNSKLPSLQPEHWLKQNSTFKQQNGEILNFETSLDVFKVIWKYWLTRYKKFFLSTSSANWITNKKP
jgi:hypothetical protein